MRRHAVEMVARISRDTLLVELGSGSSAKTRILLDRLNELAAYIPIDISADYLDLVAADLRILYPELDVRPVAADYNNTIDLQVEDLQYDRIVAYFPGSTIGNFTPVEAASFLRRIRSLIGDSGGFLVGVDLVKDRTILEAAYNDSSGVTAAFNLNLLKRINSELNADFDTNAFEHRAIFNAEESRIEMHLLSKADQDVRVEDSLIQFLEGEYIYTESSYKYTIESFRDLASTAGFESVQTWTDEDGYFSIHYLESK
jgi:dimethylhistidine N-methyltransferase